MEGLSQASTAFLSILSILSVRTWSAIRLVYNTSMRPTNLRQMGRTNIIPLCGHSEWHFLRIPFMMETMSLAKVRYLSFTPPFQDVSRVAPKRMFCLRYRSRSYRWATPSDRITVLSLSYFYFKWPILRSYSLFVIVSDETTFR
jgi:hypothetical protein